MCPAVASKKEDSGHFSGTGDEDAVVGGATAAAGRGVGAQSTAATAMWGPGEGHTALAVELSSNVTRLQATRAASTEAARSSACRAKWGEAECDFWRDQGSSPNSGVSLSSSGVDDPSASSPSSSAAAHADIEQRETTADGDAEG